MLAWNEPGRSSNLQKAMEGANWLNFGKAMDALKQTLAKPAR
jgi:hypothetical protein